MRRLAALITVSVLAITTASTSDVARAALSVDDRSSRTVALPPPAATSATGSTGTSDAPTRRLRVGVGRTDITPAVGGYLGGWACTCAAAEGVLTRLFARAVVLQQGPTKVALVSLDAAFTSGGMVQRATELVGRGYSPANVVVSATHTHGSPTGYMTADQYNSVLPSTQTPTEGTGQDAGFDQRMFDFMTRQLARAIRAADDDLAPGAAAWAQVPLRGITVNRSLEAHLGSHGIDEPVGDGTRSQDPQGADHTVDENIDVLRVDKLVGGSRRSVPVGMFSVFANHGTATGPELPLFTADHQGSAARYVEQRIRRLGGVPPRQVVVNAFGQGAAGDMSSGLTRTGPAWADEVGRREGRAMVRAWTLAGRRLDPRLPMDSRWTRYCMCGQATSAGRVDTRAVIGVAASAGSEELRTVFNEALIGEEGRRLPVPVGPQGYKVPGLDVTDGVPTVLPGSLIRIGDRLVATLPGEPTIAAGDVIRRSLLPIARSAGIRRVVVVGYAGEYVSYITEPGEYDRQHYEGGFTLFGRAQVAVMRDQMVELARRLVSGRRAQTPYPFDPTYGIRVTDSTYGKGARTASLTGRATSARRLGHATVSWDAGPAGLDRPVGTAFVRVERKAQDRWRPVTDDLGVQIVWAVDDEGAHRASWEVPRSAARGTYRFRITARQYRLTSTPFRVRAGAWSAVVTGRTVRLRLPAAQQDRDWTYRPRLAAGLAATFRLDGRTQTRRTAGTALRLPRGAVVAAGGLRDAHGNANRSRFRVG